MTDFLSFYVCVLFFIVVVSYVGYEQTLVLVDYMVKRGQILWIEWRLEVMRKRLSRELESFINNSK